MASDTDRARRCLAIGHSHAIRHSTVNALALYSRALALSQQQAKGIVSASAATTSGPLKLDITESDISNLAQHLASLVTQKQGLVELQNIQASISNSQKAEKDLYTPRLAERLQLNQYDSNTDLSNLVSFPAQLQPIPVKPLFFDLAWNYIQYPGQHTDGGVNRKSADGNLEKVAQKAAQKAGAQPVKKGWFGFGR
jgi:signal recognition particle subunit SRP68